MATNRPAHPPTTSHNYLRKIADLVAIGGARGDTTVDVRHDDWCDALSDPSGFCNCDAEILVRGGLHVKPAPRRDDRQERP